MHSRSLFGSSKAAAAVLLLGAASIPASSSFVAAPRATPFPLQSRNVPRLPPSAAPLGAASAGGIADALGGVLGNLFGGEGGAKNKKDAGRASELKSKLLDLCRSGKATRGEVERIIEELAPLSPVEKTATSPLLQKRWLLEWTTEKEINFFSDWGISGEITQTIEGTNLANDIEFKRGGGLGVSGTLTPDDDDERGVRTGFEFVSAKLDLGERWGSYELPPVGKGWFDTMYLDGELRVDTNSRDDILVCTPCS